MMSRANRGSGRLSVVLRLASMTLLAVGCKPTEPRPDVPGGPSGPTDVDVRIDPTNGTNPGPLPWPISAPPFGYEIVRNDCQIQTGCSYPMLHYGIDLVASEDTEVRAVEAGVVTWVYMGTENWAGVMVATDGETKRGFLYSHLTDIKVVMGTRVEAGDPLGVVKKWDESGACIPALDHLHVQWIGPEVADLGATGMLTWGIVYNSTGNTLKRFDPGIDVFPPEILDAAPGKLLILCRASDRHVFDQRDGDAWIVEPVPVDVVARVEDRLREASVWRIAPFSIRLRLRAPGAGGAVLRTCGFTFEEPLPNPDFDSRTIYRQDDVAQTVPDGSARAFYFDLANDDGLGQLGGASAAAALNLSGLTPGDYVLEVDATDASGNPSGPRTMTIRIPASR